MCWSHQALVSVWVPARLRHADSAGACPRNTRSGNWAVSGNPPARISSLGLALASEPGASLAPGGRLRGEHCRIAVSSALNALISHAISSCPLIAGPPRAFDALGGCRNEKVRGPAFCRHRCLALIFRSGTFQILEVMWIFLLLFLVAGF